MITYVGKLECGGCRFWVGSKRKPGIGEPPGYQTGICRRAPPVPTSVGDGIRATVSQFPVTSSKDWCGEFQEGDSRESWRDSYREQLNRPGAVEIRMEGGGGYGDAGKPPITCWVCSAPRPADTSEPCPACGAWERDLGIPARPRERPTLRSLLRLDRWRGWGLG
jgi:hypothetical protein